MTTRSQKTDSAGTRPHIGDATGAMTTAFWIGVTASVVAVSVYVPARAEQSLATAAVSQRTELDNPEVRVHRFLLPAGAVSLAFQHLQSVAVLVRGERARVTPAGAVSGAWTSGGAVIVAAGRHQIENLDGDEVEIVWVELKKRGSRAYRGMPRDPVKLDPARTTLLVENENVRVFRHDTAVGATGPEHDHPSYLAVRVSGVNRDGGPGWFRWTNGPFSHGGRPAAQAMNVIVIEPKTGVGSTLPPRQIGGTR